jgi:hypothetical protein
MKQQSACSVASVDVLVYHQEIDLLTLQLGGDLAQM